MYTVISNLCSFCVRCEFLLHRWWLHSPLLETASPLGRVMLRWGDGCRLDFTVVSAWKGLWKWCLCPWSEFSYTESPQGTALHVSCGRVKCACGAFLPWAQGCPLPVAELMRPEWQACASLSRMTGVHFPPCWDRGSFSPTPWIVLPASFSPGRFAVQAQTVLPCLRCHVCKECGFYLSWPCTATWLQGSQAPKGESVDLRTVRSESRRRALFKFPQPAPAPMRVTWSLRKARSPSVAGSCPLSYVPPVLKTRLPWPAVEACTVRVVFMITGIWEQWPSHENGFFIKATSEGLTNCFVYSESYSS